MAKIINPILFSQYYQINASVISDAGLIDPFIDVDTPLFIDPVLLEKSAHQIISVDAVAAFRGHFSNFIRLLAIAEREGDPAWRGAQKLLNLSEPPENGLGYGGSGRSGSSRPKDVRDAIIKTSKEIIEIGVKDPEMVSLMGFFEENVGPDTISDFTTQVIINQISEITQKFCIDNGIEVHDNIITSEFKLPMASIASNKKAPILLIPMDIVRDLPIANDWSGIDRAISENSRIMQRVNTYLAGIAQPTIADRKEALRSIALSSADAFAEFLATVKEHVSTYDPNLDSLGYYKLKSILYNGLDDLKVQKLNSPEFARHPAVSVFAVVQS